jgi:GT2 family glycosyltransferase
MSPKVSLVVATYNRGLKLKDLLDDLAKQTVPVASFEVVVVDDGSKDPVATWIKSYKSPYALVFIAQKNAGAAMARHRGVEASQGDIVIITDDDMRLPADFIAEHLAAHARGATVVLGQICSAPQLGAMPVFERFHAHQLEQFNAGVEQGRIRVRGVHVCTGNLSFKREDYLAVGGFDRSLGRSEDRELGVRLEKAGGRLAFAPKAKVVHESDHADLAIWLKRAFNYGVFDHRIALKHPDVEIADPWRFFFLVNPVSRPLMLMTVGFPQASQKLTELTMQVAMQSDARGLTRAAVMGTTLAYGLEYFRGMRQDAGSLRQSFKDLRGYLRKRSRTRHGDA